MYRSSRPVENVRVSGKGKSGTNFHDNYEGEKKIITAQPLSFGGHVVSVAAAVAFAL